MKLTLYSAADIEAALPMADCVAVMKRAFADFSSGRAQVPRRTVLPIESPTGATGTLLVKPAHLPGVGLGAKLVSVFPGNAELGRPVTPGIVVHLSPETGEPVAILDGTFLTAWRTGAAGGAATDLLAAPDVTIGALFGAGDQARTQLLAMDAVRPFTEVRVFSRTPARAEELVAALQPRVGARLRVVSSPSAAIRDAQVITTATTATEPVFDGREVPPGAHISGVGSFTPDTCEVDIDTVRRARVFVDSVESAAIEPGDLLEALDAEVTRVEDWTELGRIADGSHPGRQPNDDLTFFKSVGLAVQDIAAGAVVIERGKELGLGTEVEL